MSILTWRARDLKTQPCWLCVVEAGGPSEPPYGDPCRRHNTATRGAAVTQARNSYSITNYPPSAEGQSR